MSRLVAYKEERGVDLSAHEFPNKAETATPVVMYDPETGLPFTAVPVSIAGGGNVTLNVGSIDLGAVGTTADAMATSDTGSFSIISLMKRALTNWATLLNTKLPNAVNGRIPVDIGQTLTGSFDSTGIGAPADTAATSDTGNFSLVSLTKRLLSKIPALTAGGRIPVDIGQTITVGSGSTTAANSYTAISATNTSISVLAANASRKTIFIQNLEASTVLAVGLNGQPAAYGTTGAVELQPKQTLTLEGGEAANAISMLSSKLNHQYTLSVGS